MEIHADAIRADANYLLVDDVIATGGTAGVVRELIGHRGARLAAGLFLLELTHLRGRSALVPCPIHALLAYSH